MLNSPTRRLAVALLPPRRSVTTVMSLRSLRPWASRRSASTSPTLCTAMAPFWLCARVTVKAPRLISDMSPVSLNTRSTVLVWVFRVMPLAALATTWLASSRPLGRVCVVTAPVSASVWLRSTRVCSTLPWLALSVMNWPAVAALRVASVSVMSPPLAPALRLMPWLLATTWVSASALMPPLRETPCPACSTTAPAVRLPDKDRSRPALTVSVVAASALLLPPRRMSRSEASDMAAEDDVLVFCVTVSSPESATSIRLPAHRFRVSAVKLAEMGTTTPSTSVVATPRSRRVSSARTVRSWAATILPLRLTLPPASMRMLSPPMDVLAPPKARTVASALSSTVLSTVSVVVIGRLSHRVTFSNVTTGTCLVVVCSTGSFSNRSRSSVTSLKSCWMRWSLICFHFDVQA